METGHVRLNRAKVTKPVGGHVRILRVKDLGIKRGPFAEACQLYEDLTPGPSRDEKDRA